MPDIDKAISELVQRRLEEEREKSIWSSGSAIEERADLLKQLSDEFLREHTSKFKPGQIVVWKDGLKNRRKPVYNEPAIVMQVLDQPIFDPNQETGSAYFKEPLDLVLGLIDGENDFVLYHFDSRRLRLS